VQETVLQPCALDHNMVGKLEATLEGPLGDALIENVARLLLVSGLFLAADRQRVSLASSERSASVNPATATEMRNAFSPFRSIL
jgi:hypothetical protein